MRLFLLVEPQVKGLDVSDVSEEGEFCGVESSSSAAERSWGLLLAIIGV